MFHECEATIRPDAYRVSNPPDVVQPRTFDDLLEFLGKSNAMFDNVTGPARAYFDFPMQHPGTGKIDLYRLVYTSVLFHMDGERRRTEEYLVQSFWDMLVWARGQLANVEHYKEPVPGLIFWRRLPHIEEVPARPAGYHEDFETSDGRWWPGNPSKTTLRARMAIPTVDLSKYFTERYGERGEG